jgi:hypothetical protein
LTIALKNTEKHNALTAESGMYAMILLLFLMIFLSVLFLIFHVRNLKKEKIFLRMNQELTGLPSKYSFIGMAITSTVHHGAV